MSDFIIPKGKRFVFTLTVMEADSFIAQNLQDLDTMSMTIIRKDVNVSEGIVADTGVVVSLVKTDEANGRITGTISNTETDKLEVSTGPKEDNYYLKSNYQGVIELTFTNDVVNPMNVVIKDIYVSPTGV